ncbi:MAG: efflux RND transporter periplasmic adaptor subunit [Candidatus Aenigmarchaeota archaeon]|nr:efflux RND transporter periplasmic adaptor subunit [Candidatus Aenigmarchaeota archaeon]
MGGFFQKNEILFEIEDSDYRLALEKAKAVKAKAEYDLATIESQARIARREWKKINNDSQTPPNPLVLYEPQLKNARAALISASAAIEQAELDLERTKIKAPFNCRVRSEDIDLGQYVRTGDRVAELAGTDTAEIHVPLSADDLRWLHIPLYGKTHNGSPAYISVHIGGKQYTWQGRVVRSTGEVDPKSRMMQLVVEIKDPYGIIEQKDPAHPVLASGTFVIVQIRGKTLKDVFVIPRIAFRDNSTVWLMNKENKLRIKNVIPVRIEKEKVIIGKSLDDGDMIVLTNISGAADGMKLRAME